GVRKGASAFAPRFALLRETPNRLTRSPHLPRRCSGCRRRLVAAWSRCCLSSMPDDKLVSVVDNPRQGCPFPCLVLREERSVGRGDLCPPSCTGARQAHAHATGRVVDDQQGSEAIPRQRGRGPGGSTAHPSASLTASRRVGRWTLCPQELLSA